VAAVLILSVDAARTEPSVEALTGSDKLSALLAARWHGQLVESLALSAQFEAVTRLAGATPCVRLVRPRSAAPPARLAALVEELVS
jgi:hypothetical protein